jgi:hypothetical protein
MTLTCKTVIQRRLLLYCYAYFMLTQERYLQSLPVFNESLLLSIFCMPYSDALPKRFDSIISIVFCLLADNI